MPLVDPLSAVNAALQKAEVIPDIIPADPPFAPEALLSLRWPTGVEAQLGNTLTKDDTADVPTIHFTPMQAPVGAADDVSYTLVMVDPDAPSKEDRKWGPFRHWIVSGVKAPAISALAAGNMSASFTHAEACPYMPPTPPTGSGPHRYIVLLYQDPHSNFNVPLDALERKTEAEDRMHWKAADFAKAHNLTLVAANFFYVHGLAQE